MSEIFTLGIDVGSTASKCIILKDGKEIVGKSLIDVGAGTSGPSRAIEAVLEDAGLKKEDMAFTLATHFLLPNAHNVIAIGGQDVKVLRVEDGVMTNFQMNDKCAAGTGRFLDVMARVLEVEVSDLGRLGAMSKKQVGISSTCTVFAESEVISQLSMGTDKCDIIAGIHRSVAHRVTGLAHRIGVVPDVVMTGGVAQNQGVVDALEAELGVKICTSPLTQYNGALGAALMAYQVASRQK